MMGNRLSAGDGFKFGCGFFAAGCLAYAAILGLSAMAMAALSMAGMTGFLSQLLDFSR